MAHALPASAARSGVLAVPHSVRSVLFLWPPFHMIWRWRLAPTPPSLLPFTVHPWVIANDRLRADCWQPASSNEEAYVGAHRAGPWATLSPRRRQELALGAAGAALLGGAALAVVALRRRRR